MALRAGNSCLARLRPHWHSAAHVPASVFQSFDPPCRRFPLMESRWNWNWVPLIIAYLCAVASMIYFHKGETFFAFVQAFWAVVFFVYWRVKYGKVRLIPEMLKFFIGLFWIAAFLLLFPILWPYGWLRRRYFPPPQPAEIDAAAQALPSLYYGYKCSCGHITFGGPAPDDPDFFVKGETGICGKCHSRVEIKPENVHWTDYGPELHSNRLH